MKQRLSYLSAIAVALSMAASAGAARNEPVYLELPRFYKVNDHLYRGAQPRKGGIKKLADLGIKSIINLRGKGERTRAEQAEAQALGLRYFSVSMSGLRRPTDEQVRRVMAIIDAPENRPVFVHCNHGANRTGTIIAVYRISHDGWTGKRALSEAKKLGMSWLQFRMKGYISDYYRNSRRSKQSTLPLHGPAKPQDLPSAASIGVICFLDVRAGVP